MKEEYQNILEQLSDKSSLYSADVLIGTLRVKRYLDDEAVNDIKKQGTLAEKRVKLFYYLGFLNETFLEELEKIFRKNKWEDAANFIQLEKAKVDAQLSATNTSSGIKQMASNSGEESKKEQKQFNQTDIYKNLLSIFDSNSLVPPKDYWPGLLNCGFLTDIDIEDIKVEHRLNEQQIIFSHKLAIHGIEAVRKLYKLSKVINHGEFSRALKTAFDFED